MEKVVVWNLGRAPLGITGNRCPGRDLLRETLLTLLAPEDADMFAGIWSAAHPAADLLGVGPGAWWGDIVQAFKIQGAWMGFR